MPNDQDTEGMSELWEGWAHPDGPQARGNRAEYLTDPKRGWAGARQLQRAIVKILNIEIPGHSEDYRALSPRQRREREVARMLDLLPHLIAAYFARGQSVRLPGLGRFSLVRRKSARFEDAWLYLRFRPAARMTALWKSVLMFDEEPIVALPEGRKRERKGRPLSEDEAAQENVPETLVSMMTKLGLCEPDDPWARSSKQSVKAALAPLYRGASKESAERPSPKDIRLKPT